MACGHIRRPCACPSDPAMQPRPRSTAIWCRRAGTLVNSPEAACRSLLAAKHLMMHQAASPASTAQQPHDMPHLVQATGALHNVHLTSVAQQHRARLAVCNTDSQDGAFQPVQACHRRCLGPGGPWSGWEGPGGCCCPRGDPLGVQGQVHNGHLATPCDGHHQQRLPTAGRKAHCSCSLMMRLGDDSKKTATAAGSGCSTNAGCTLPAPEPASASGHAAARSTGWTARWRHIQQPPAEHGGIHWIAGWTRH